MLKNDQGQWIDNVDQLQEMVNGFYKKLFTDNGITRDWFQTEITYPELEQSLLSSMAAPISKEEVKRALFNMHPWKAPGPDGFPAGFYQKSWEVVGETVCEFVNKVWEKPSEIAEVNQTDICLIPKITHPEYVKQFRPISLCNTNYKIVSKVVVERLKDCIAVRDRKWHGIKAGRNGPEISHLMFADDLLLFGEATEKQMCCVMQVLNSFCNLSGQEISHEKTSILFSKNVDRGKKTKLLQISGFHGTEEFGNYLGVPLIGRAPKRRDYQYLVDQVSLKLSRWKATQLSFAGRLTLAKSVMEAVPIYPMMSSKIPKSCLDDIQKMQRSFIWGDTEQKKHFHAIRWEQITVPKWLGGLGVRKLDVMNNACLMKLNWSYQGGSNDLWCKVLRGKYEEARVQSQQKARGTDSSLWKNLVQLKPMLEEFSFWHVGDGASVDAWKQAWLDEGLCIEQHVAIPNHLQGLKVCDLVDSDGKWNWTLLDDWLPIHLKNKVAAILPPDMNNGSDERIGVGGKKCNFSISNMYHNLCSFNKRNVNPMWCKVWKLQVPERVRTFMWLVMHKRLLTNSLKSSMGLGHAMCNFCSDVEETIIHVMRDCPIAVNFWNQVIPVVDRGVFYMGEINQWMNFNLNNSIKWINNGNWCSFWALGCFCLWKWRNQELHEDSFVRPSMPVHHVGRMAMEYRKAMSNSELALGRTRAISMIRWSPPKANFVKLNTDGACKEHIIAGCGGIVRGSEGEWIGGFAKCVGMCNAFIAEMWGVLEGLRYVRRLGFRKVELNIDSAAVVQVIKTGRLQSSTGSALARQIWKLMAMDWEVEVNHIYREANKCADALANMGSNFDYDIKIFYSCPSQLYICS
ncbi:hypothetical protein TSUD_270960 [Trifolium subterraneum]|uniref:RNase H type-1 domain-containing protein n=1 Tax=Trifolium subterraneum TaxID=3900 RepID=A0A2Z6MJS8_TRISU|nr:hypothetical protein TSUD_270960 [Trifolium subterraneum]